MVKYVDLDLEFERWKADNEQHLIEVFLEAHNFHLYLEEAWQEYQQKHDLMDKTSLKT